MEGTMKISKIEMKRLKVYKPELLKTLLYFLAFADKDGLITLDRNLMGDLLNRNPFQTQDYIQRLIDNQFIKPITTLEKNGNMVYKILINYFNE